MKKTDITKQNIHDIGYIIGPSAGSKGTKIFNYKSMCLSYWKSNEDDNGVEYLEKFKASLAEYDLDTIFVSSIVYEQDESFEFNHKKYSLLDESLRNHNLRNLVDDNFSNVKHVSLAKMPSLLGHIKISKYGQDLDSQKELLKDLINMSEDELHGEIEDDMYDAEDGVQEFGYRNGEYCNGDYTLEHGESCYVEEKNECVFLNGRCSDNNNVVADDFWRDGFDESDWLKEIDPNNEIAVYHRKGKDFYIGYTLELQEQELIWRVDGEKYEVGDYESDTFCYMSCTPNGEKLDEIEAALKSMKEGFEFNSYVYNELEIDDCNEYSEWQNDDIFDLYLFDLIFDSREDAKNAVFEIISTKDKTKEEACVEANNRIIAEHVIFNFDYSIVVEENRPYSKEPPQKRTYNQLKVVKRLENRLGYKLVWSRVNDYSSVYGFAIKQDDEEYHFGLEELFDEVSGLNTIGFIQACLTQINKRKMFKISSEELHKRASTVFIGVQDSYMVGNCKFGTEEFLQRHHIDTNVTGGIRGDVLLEYEESNFTKNMVIYKLNQVSNHERSHQI